MQLEDASHTTGRATHVRYVVLIFLCVLAFLTYFDRVCIASAQADIERDLRLTDAQMGLILGGFWLAYGLFEIPGGWMGDRFGSRYTLSRIVLAWSIFTALSGSAIGFLSLFACRFFFGVGEAGAFPNMARVQSRWFPLVAQGRVGGMLWLVARWGGALSFALFPLLMSAAGSPSFRHVLGRLPGSLATVPSWRIAFWICGLLGLVWVATFFLWFRDDPAEKSSVDEAELALIRAGRAQADPHAQTAMSRRLWVELFSSGRLWAIAAAYMCGSFGWSFFVSWMPRYMTSVHHPSATMGKWLNTTPLLVGGAACMLGGALSDQLVRASGSIRLGRGVFPVFGYTTAAISMACIPFAHTPGQAIALMCLGSFGNDMGQAAQWASIINVGGRYAGTAFGMINMVANVGGNFLQPIIGAEVFGHYGWPPLFALYGGVFLTSAILWVFIDPTRQFYRDDAPPGGFAAVPLASRKSGPQGS
ncbi:MAG TPA: MFS transporter [Tepidisphaeraceae bacterium]|jgi:ACS family glucarate transporter-like MFS transporter|nr:MFS transporter [Tepidisphaeraceae bacterium]